ncbi:isoprenylcysteine carboxylmethyltransferase family protein [Niveibacterium sp. SC-1]|uniref:methyltransferase family protein n=1 Tax=Niveibacterium sp. SC-1 TaxID=3135646 RepID=UPI00311D94F9
MSNNQYGLWGLAAINIVFFIAFAASFYKPYFKRDWRSFGLYSAFIVALFAEMYGFPLTLYLLSGWLGTRYPEIGLATHDAGHLWEILFGWRGNPHFGPFHIASNLLIVAGLWLLAKAWPVLYVAQREGRLAASGPYARIRHPQYAAFVMVMLGFLLQWPTLITLVMFPVLATVYVRLARREEGLAAAEFGEAWAHYAARTPAFIPHRRSAQGES